MATVYLARDLKHNRRVALKVLHPDLAQALGAERFLREIEIASQLSHPHILPLYDSGGADGLLYYVMPYVAGESLRQRLGPGAPAAGGSGASAGGRDRPGLGLRPRAGGDPPGHQAGEHPAAGSAGPGGRLRDLPRHQRFAEARRRSEADRDRAHAGDAGVHESGAGLGRPVAGWPERSLQPGLRGVRDADGGAARSAVPRPRRSWRGMCSIRYRRCEPCAPRCRSTPSERSGARWARCRPTGSRRRRTSPRRC